MISDYTQHILLHDHCVNVPCNVRKSEKIDYSESNNARNRETGGNVPIRSVVHVADEEQIKEGVALEEH